MMARLWQQSGGKKQENQHGLPFLPITDAVCKHVEGSTLTNCLPTRVLGQDRYTATGYSRNQSRISFVIRDIVVYPVDVWPFLTQFRKQLGRSRHSQVSKREL